MADSYECRRRTGVDDRRVVSVAGEDLGDAVAEEEPGDAAGSAAINAGQVEVGVAEAARADAEGVGEAQIAARLRPRLDCRLIFLPRLDYGPVFLCPTEPAGIYGPPTVREKLPVREATRRARKIRSRQKKQRPKHLFSELLRPEFFTEVLPNKR